MAFFLQDFSFKTEFPKFLFFHDVNLELWQEHVGRIEGYLHVTKGVFIHLLVVMKSNHGDARILNEA